MMPQQPGDSVGQRPLRQSVAQLLERRQGAFVQRLDLSLGLYCLAGEQMGLYMHQRIGNVPASGIQAPHDSGQQLPQLGSVRRAGNCQRQLLSVYTGHLTCLAQSGWQGLADMGLRRHKLPGHFQNLGTLLVTGQPAQGVALATAAFASRRW